MSHERISNPVPEEVHGKLVFEGDLVGVFRDEREWVSGCAGKADGERSGENGHVHVPVGEGVLKRCTLPLLFNETKTLSLSGSQPYYVSFVTWYQNKVLRRVDIKSQSTLLSDKARDRFQKERETIAYYS
jgi:hypothetical protein